ncbi:MAG TPA: RnfABCDGE type electron transport complex subunit D [Candidatus Baltobacterales bacterium]|nr:RnfABCDGE type electron transport complex subunit D [Candidatus Baltobacterales bacterium]
MQPRGSWIARVGVWLDRAAFKPASLPDDLVTGIALTPPVVAGLVIFKFPAFEMLLVALAVGAAAQLAVRWLWRHHIPRTSASPMIAAIFGVALVGAGAGLVTSVEISLLAVVLESLRARYVPAIRAQAGLLAYAAVALATRGAANAYLNPASGKPFGDPISTWYRFFSPESAPIDPIRLYVGNVPGPVFATSLLAVAIGVAWLAYARRLSFVVLITFLAGAWVAINTFHWDYMFQLDSGPTWFVAGLVLADRRLLPGSWAIRPALGFAAGLFAIGLRRNGYGIEAALFTVAVGQAVMAVVAVVFWAASSSMERWKRNRRLAQRDANLKVVKSIPRAS